VSFAPLLDAAPQIPLHAFAAMAAFVLGLVQFAAPKGTLAHRTIGWIWVALMAAVAVSSFWIHQLRLVGPFSPIHLLSIFTLMVLPLAVWAGAPPRGPQASDRDGVAVCRRACHRRACSRCCRGGSCTRSCSVPEGVSARFPGPFSGRRRGAATAP
jgi:uncharacterized membrane protein